MIKEKQENQSQKKYHQILAANMWSIYNFGDPNLRYRRFLSNGRTAFKSFIESVLLYDEVVVPTQDFISLAILVGVLGERAILDLLSEKSLKFLRINGAFSYIGNGGGIQTFEIFEKSNGTRNPFCSPLDEAISWALGGLQEKPKDQALPKAVLNATTEIKLSSIKNEIRHETYMDILNSSYLRNQFAIKNKDMNHLTGIEPNAVRIYGGSDADSWKGDEIDIVLLMATTNLELYLTGWLKCEDLTTSNPIGHILKAKAERSFGRKVTIETFNILQQIADIPDIGEGVLTNQIKIRNLLKIKQSKDGEEFRKWFHSHCQGNTVSIAKEYINLLKQIPKIQTLPLRIIRFILTTGIGAIPGIGNILGAVTGGVDSFFLERWFHGSSPKFFIDNLKQLSN